MWARLLSAACVAAGWHAGLAFHCPPVKFQDNAVAVEMADGRVFIPVYRHEPQGGRKAVRTVVIALHGAGRNGDNYYDWVTSAMTKHGLQEEIAVVVPVFADADCTAAAWTGDEDATGDGIKWSHSTRQWVFGQNSDKDGDWHGISSYQVIDDLVEYADSRYRHAHRIVVTGFSAGAQMGLRWAILSPQGIKKKTLGGTSMTIVLGSPSSVTYLSDERPAASCTLHADQDDPNHNCTDFVKPGHDSRLKTCHGHWDQYAFGIDGLEWKHTRAGSLRGDVARYLQQYVHDEDLLDTVLVQRFASKDIVFQFGDEDTKSCNRGQCSKDCPAMLEGNTRLQRGLNYMWYLKWVLPGYTPQYSLFHGGHRPELFFAGEYFNKKAFNREGWDECLWDSLTCFSLLVKGILMGVGLIFTTGFGVYYAMHRHIKQHYIPLHHKTSRDLEAARKLLRVKK